MLEAAKRMTMNGHDVSLRKNEVSRVYQVICNNSFFTLAQMEKGGKSRFGASSLGGLCLCFGTLLWRFEKK